MKKLTILFLIVALGTSSLWGCANIKDDKTRTKTEGTLVGGGLGAAIGAGIGALVGGKKGALIGAGIGTGVGAAVGFGVGTHIANKKAEYASEEDWLDACISEAQKSNEILKEHNRELSAELKTLEKQTAALQKSYASKKSTKAQLSAEKKKIDQRLKNSQQMASAANTEIQEQGKALADARSSGKKAQAAKLEAQINSLKKQKQQLEDNNRKLTAMSSRLSV
ncbi:hypothetical protein LJC46_04725 [Desulfovibrio sp. OttesenSCG-928-G15]|nr:hypothetical protein [Desulfovibrio sp. OttesenSCG-928-G15]